MLYTTRKAHRSKTGASLDNEWIPLDNPNEWSTSSEEPERPEEERAHSNDSLSCYDNQQNPYDGDN